MGVLGALIKRMVFIVAGAAVTNGIASGCSALAPVAIGFLVGVIGGYTGGLMFLVGLTVLGLFCTTVLALETCRERT